MRAGLFERRRGAGRWGLEDGLTGVPDRVPPFLVPIRGPSWRRMPISTLRRSRRSTRGSSGSISLRHGPTMETLALIASRPEVRAEDLSALVGREKPPFKLDVRKPGEPGPGPSLRVGYRLSPRGRSYLRATTAAALPDCPGDFEGKSYPRPIRARSRRSTRSSRARAARGRRCGGSGAWRQRGRDRSLERRARGRCGFPGEEWQAAGGRRERPVRTPAG